MRTLPQVSRFARPIVLALVLALGLVMLANSPAHAISGLYLQVGGGVADYSDSQLNMEELPDTNSFPVEGSSPPLAIAAQFRLGYSIFGFGGPEFTFIGTGWDSFGGGGGFIGGGVRLYPLKFLSLAGMDTDEFPIDLSTGVNFGYTIVGQDFAYTGTFWDFDVTLDYKVTSFMSVGARLDVLLPQFDDFVFTSFSSDLGRCLDSSGNHDLSGGGVPFPREDAMCSGQGPDTTILSPQLVVTFHFNLFGL